MEHRAPESAFGTPIPDCPYVVRPSVYALVADDDGRIAVARTSKGYILPGGGIEGGESAEQAVRREAIEECGLVLMGCRPVGTAVEIVYSKEEHTCFEKQCIFFEARVRRHTAATEPDHELVWMTLEEAVDRLSHESHRWAVRTFR